MKRAVAIVAVPLLLGGCIPLPITLGSTLVSGISYLDSGKFTADHMISASMGQDCELTRVLESEDVCQTATHKWPVQTAEAFAHPSDGAFEGVNAEPRPSSTIAAAEPSEIDVDVDQSVVVAPFVSIAPIAEPVSSVLATSDGVEVEEGVRAITAVAPAEPWTAPAPIARIEIAVAPVVDPTPESEITGSPSTRFEAATSGPYVVIGSLRNEARARDLAARFADLGARVVDAEVKGQRWNRVVLGPFAPDHARAVRDDIGEVQGKTPWVVRLTDPVITQVASL